MNHQLTKTDFIQYLNCSKSLWLLKNRPEDYKKGEMSLFLEKLIAEGYEVEEQAQKLFPNAITLPDFGDPSITRQALKENGSVFFQASFQTASGAFARIDILEKLDDGTFHIYEIKSSTSIKKDKKHNHLKDACFQKYVMTESGYEVSKISIIHLNKDYVRSGDINPSELLVIEDVTEEIGELYESVSSYIVDSLGYINKENISLDTCYCREDTRSNHCDSFTFFNPDIPEYSIYELGNIRQKRIRELADMDVMKISDIPLDYEGLNENQKLQMISCKKEQAIIDTEAIKESLSILEFPLHFIDYETYASAVPKIDGIGPHQHVVFQVSIHTMQEDGSIQHYEYLTDKLELPEKLIQYMQSVTGNTGTYISWHASFEKTQNTAMATWFLPYAEYLNNMSLRMYDLEDIFKKDYIDYQFHGSSSIKKVLPVLCPELSYNELDVQNGTMALDTWGRMVLDPDFDEDIETTRKNLLEYCKLDTLAMVELYKKLTGILISPW
jgi:CRISPR/Cas system-associated exonuclease Cas4 (RecB family)